MTFDQMTRPEFAELFRRSMIHVPTKGVTSSEELDSRILRAEKKANEEAKEAEYAGYKRQARQLRYGAKQLAKLYNSDFSQTAIRHAALYPKDIVNLSFLFGKKTAVEIRLAAARTRARIGKSGHISPFSKLHRRF